jgi:hypothetical protein
MLSSFSGLKTANQQQQQTRMRQPLKNNMIGLSSVSYVKKSMQKDVPPSIPTSMSSPRISSGRSPFVPRKNQLPMFIRKQKLEENEDEEEDDDREIVKNNNSGLLNPYGLPTNNNRTQSTQKKSDLNQKIRVCVRKRPLSKKEVEKSEKDITPVKSVGTVHVNEPK